MNKTVLQIATAIGALIVVVISSAIGATLQAGGLEAFKSSPIWVNLLGLLTCGAATFKTGSWLAGEPRIVEKIVEKRVEAPTPTRVASATAATFIEKATAAMNTGGSMGAACCTKIGAQKARAALDTLLWHLHEVGKFAECEAAANTFQKAIYGEEKKNESSVQPPAPPAVVAPVVQPVVAPEPVVQPAVVAEPVVAPAAVVPPAAG